MGQRRVHGDESRFPLRVIMRTFSATFFLAFAVSISIAVARRDGLDDFFHALDKDGHGYIACGDLATRIEASGKIPEGANTESNLRKFDANGDANLDSAEFTSMIEFDMDHFVNPRTLDFFKTMDANGDDCISKLEFLVDVVAIETALGVDVDGHEIDSYFDKIDSDGDGNIQVWEFYAIPNAPVDRLACGGLCVFAGTALVAAFDAWWG